MELDHKYRSSNNGMGGRIILLGDGTEIATDEPDSEMFDQDDEDRDLDSQVNKYQSEHSSNGEDVTHGRNPEAPQATESPSSIKTEESDGPSQHSTKDTRLPDKVVADEKTSA
jgi:protein phosphatase 2C family protein 2/3